MSQYERDIAGPYREVFLKLRELLLSKPEMQEQKGEHQTSYRIKEGVVVMLRGREDHLVAAFGAGAKLFDRYPFLQGSGKVVRHLYFKSVEELDSKLFLEMVEESIMLHLERDEMMKLRRALKKRDISKESQ